MLLGYYIVLEGLVNAKKVTALISSNPLIAWLRAKVRDWSLHLKWTLTDLALFQTQRESFTGQ